MSFTTFASPPRRLWFWRCISIISFLFAQEATAQLNNHTSPTHQFKSRPDLHAPIINYTVLRPELVIPGYIFLGPYRNVDPGPYIYDNAGELVWSGAGQNGPHTSHTPRVCQYKGEDHLCFFTGEQHQGFARGHGVIMNKHYRTVKTIEAQGAGASCDMHEFKMTPFSNGTTVLATVYQPRQYDLTTNPRFNLQDGMGWIVEGVFQEIEIETGRLVFEWRSLDHVDPSQAWTLPGSTDTSGTGMHEQEPWDYFHINSIDKNSEGDFLISARHVSAIYKLSGKDGSILWQLGGSSPTFEQTNFKFSYQHHARWISENATHTVFSFYDNASNNYNRTGDFSHGWIILIDHIAGTATMVKEWGAPEPKGGLLSTSQGNMQMLPHGGCHIGWGEHAYYSEHTADGEVAMYAKVAQRASNVMIYRSNKYNWTAEPLTSPALWTYSRTGEEKTGFWVSWNGATEVKSWSFYTGDSANGPWQFAGNEWKLGFETEHQVEKFSPWAYAEALDGEGRSLGRSVISKTFVPSEHLRDKCDDRGCEYASKVKGEAATPYEAKVQTPLEHMSPNRGYNTSHYYQDMPNMVKNDDDEDGLSGGEPSAFAVGTGLLFGFTAVLVGYFAWRRGGWRRVQDAVANSSLGSQLHLGRYARVRQKDVEGWDSERSSSGLS